MLFPVVDKFQAALDTKTGCSTGFSKQMQEGRRKISSDLTFDYAQGKQKQVERNLVKGTSKEQTASIPACVTDSLSAIFYIGIAADGGWAELPVSAGGLHAHGDGDHEGRGEGRDQDPGWHVLRRFACEPTADEGIVKNRGKIWVWYIDDARHIPVQIRAQPVLGNDYGAPAIV